jgi:hypothetical protein
MPPAVHTPMIARFLLRRASSHMPRLRGEVLLRARSALALAVHARCLVDCLQAARFDDNVAERSRDDLRRALVESAIPTVDAIA